MLRHGRGCRRYATCRANHCRGWSDSGGEEIVRPETEKLEQEEVVNRMQDSCSAGREEATQPGVASVAATQPIEQRLSEMTGDGIVEPLDRQMGRTAPPAGCCGQPARSQGDGAGLLDGPRAVQQALRHFGDPKRNRS
jgi:hypothetical protein